MESPRITFMMIAEALAIETLKSHFISTRKLNFYVPVSQKKALSTRLSE